MSRVKSVLLVVQALFYVAAGINHFRSPDFYLAIMPPWMPWHRELVALSGVAEIVLGALLLPRVTRRFAAWGIVAMLIAFLPVHVHMLVNAELYPQVPVAFLWLRFPIQAVLIAWAWWYTRTDS